MDRKKIRDVYRYIDYLNDGRKIEGDAFEKDHVVKLELIPLFEHIPEVSVGIDGEKELMFHIRRICNLMNGTFVKTIYFIGHKIGKQKFLLSVDSSTGKVEIEDDPNK